MVLLVKGLILLEGGEHNNMSIAKERVKVRSLKDIRNANRRDDLLFSGMEEKPKALPADFCDNQKKYYQEVVKPTVERVINRQFED